MVDHNKTTVHKRVSLPKDTGPHALTDMEWWYYFAFLSGDQGGKYAVMSAFYQAGELPVLKGHYLIFSLIDLTNLTNESFSFIDRKLAQNILYINIPLYLLQCPNNEDVYKLAGYLAKDRLPPPHRWLSGASIEKDPVILLYDNSSVIFKDDKDGHFKSTIAGDGIKASLEFKSIKPVSLIGGNGKPDRLYYYSFTRNEVTGCIKKGMFTENVTGEGWFDHQWGYLGDLLTKTGWNWFGLQLDDGRELLLNEFRSIKTGESFSPMANLIEPDGRLKFTRSLTFKPLNSWRSHLTDAVYPVDWVISIPEFKMELSVSKAFPEQEMPVIGPLNAIWEGPCTVMGSEAKHSPVSGKGFMELVGYANYIC